MRSSTILGQAEYGLTLVDAGGTTETFMVVGVDKEGCIIPDCVVSEMEMRAPVINLPVGDKTYFYDETASHILEVQGSATRFGVKVLPLVFFGTPGRLVKGRIAPTTAGNLGSSFDGVCPQEELSRRLNQEVHAVNDAIAQMGAGLNALLHVPDFGEKLKGKKVAYVGPGTGLGGGFGVVNHDYSLDYFTDGHIFDMQVPGYTGTSVKFSVPSVKGHAEIQSRFAEDVLSGRAVRQIACAIDRHLIQHDKEPLFLPLVLGYSKMSPKDRERALDHYNNKSPVDAHLVGVEVLGKEKPAGKVRKAFPVAEMISDFEGEMLGRLVQCIYTGSIIKATEGAQWPPDDARKVSGITDYLIGGSVGTKGEMGRIVRETAVHYLKGVFPNTEFNFFVIGDCKNAGALGTAAFLKRQDILGAMRVLSDSS